MLGTAERGVESTVGGSESMAAGGWRVFGLYEGKEEAVLVG